MAFKPRKSGARTLRELVHTLFRDFTDVGDNIGDEGDFTPPDPVPEPGHQHWHDNLINVLPDQHHPQMHSLGSHDNVDLVDNGLLEGQGIWYDADTSTWRNRVAYEESFPTGLADGGELNIGPGINDIEVLAGAGVLVDAYTNPFMPPALSIIIWEQINTAITAAPATAGSVVWFSLASTGIPAVPPNYGGVPAFTAELKQYAQPPGPSLSRAEVFLGVALHNGVAWSEVSNPKVINQAAETLREVATTVLPLSSIISGGEVTPVSTLNLNQAAGVIWEQNRNWHNDKSDPNREILPASAPINFQYVNRDFTDVGAVMPTVEPDMWDNAGVVEAIPGGPSGETTIQRLYIDPANNYWMLWGQTIYPSFFTAQANLYAEVPVIPFILQRSILLGFVVSEKGKADWDNNEAIFVGAGGQNGGASGGGTPITDHDNLNGITANNHHNQAHLLYGADHTDVSTTVPVEIGSGLVWTSIGKFEALNLWTVSGYGGIRQTAPVGIGNIGIGWEVLVADAVSVATPRAVTQNTGANALSFDLEGVWPVSVAISLSHNETNGSRTFNIRLYNITKATGGVETVVGVGRNTDTTTFSTSILADIGTGEVGDLWRVEVGGTASSITAVIENSYSFSANLVSEYRG